MAEIGLPDTTPEDPDGGFLNEKVLFLKRWTWIKVVVVGFILVTSFGFWRQGQNQENDLSRQVQTDYRQCLEFNKVTGIVLNLVEASATQGFDPAAIPSFANVDPATQQFFKDLLAMSANQDPENESSFINIARKLLEPRNCEGLYPNHK